MPRYFRGAPVSVAPGDVLAMPFPAGGELYRICRSAFLHTYAPVENVPSHLEVLANWEARLRREGTVYSKTPKIHAKRALESGVLDTIVDGFMETRRSYEKGDFLVCGVEGERYTIGALDFALRYDISKPEPASDSLLSEENFYVYRPTGKIWALELTLDNLAEYFPAGQFIASW